jgi:hypothetical protein
VVASELDELTAHTLVGYMYTGKYTDLRSSIETKVSAVAKYEAGTCVYCAAVRYQLLELAELAKSKIMAFGEEVSISDVLKMAKNRAYPLLPENETWYPAYLEGAIKSAMAKDPEPFKRPDFITQVEGNSRLLQVVWKTVISNYAGTVAAPIAQDDVVEAKVQKHDNIEEVAIAQSPSPASVDGSQTTAVANDISVRSPSPATPYGTRITAAALFEDNLKLDDIEPTVETHQVPEPFTDELGFEKSKTYQKMSKNETDPTPSVLQANGLGQPTHKRSDSMMQAEDAVTEPMKAAEEAVTTPMEETEEADKYGETSPLTAHGSTNGATASKKSRKKKRGTKSSIVS